MLREPPFLQMTRAFCRLNTQEPFPNSTPQMLVRSLSSRPSTSVVEYVIWFTLIILAIRLPVLLLFPCLHVYDSYPTPDRVPQNTGELTTTIRTPTPTKHLRNDHPRSLVGCCCFSPYISLIFRWPCAPSCKFLSGLSPLSSESICTA